MYILQLSCVLVSLFSLCCITNDERETGPWRGRERGLNDCSHTSFMFPCMTLYQIENSNFVWVGHTKYFYSNNIIIYMYQLLPITCVHTIPQYFSSAPYKKSINAYDPLYLTSCFTCDFLPSKGNMSTLISYLFRHIFLSGVIFQTSTTPASYLIHYIPKASQRQYMFKTVYVFQFYKLPKTKPLWNRCACLL